MLCNFRISFCLPTLDPEPFLHACVTVSGIIAKILYVRNGARFPDHLVPEAGNLILFLLKMNKVFLAAVQP